MYLHFNLKTKQITDAEGNNISYEWAKEAVEAGEAEPGNLAFAALIEQDSLMWGVFAGPLYDLKYIVNTKIDALKLEKRLGEIDSCVSPISISEVCVDGVPALQITEKDGQLLGD